ncbi:MAG: gluconate 2-dehydrogenase subunit 3 family protein [Bacteroidota bacterium]
MDRRESLKNLLIGAAATSALFTGCEAPVEVAENVTPVDAYPFVGSRTQWEVNRDARMQAVEFFTPGEREVVDVLADIILPADDSGPAASTTGVTDFIEFMANDYPNFQLPLRAGLSWISSECLERFGNNDFTQIEAAQQLELVDEIAYLPEDPKEELTAPIAFFDLLRGLVLTGYFTSKEGIKDIDYQGNLPNVWDGVPDEVLAKHGVEYDPEWVPKFIDQNTRNDAAEWDEKMNLLS